MVSNKRAAAMRLLWRHVTLFGHPSIEENMMKRTTLAMLTALVCASAPTSEQAYAQNSDAAAQLDQFDFMVGDWNCTGTLFASGTRPAHATTARAHGEKTLDDQWVMVRYDEDKTSANPSPFHVHQYFRYDPAGKQFKTVGIDSAEASGFVGVSHGWSGNSMVFEESTGGKTSESRDTFSKGTNELSHSGTALDKNKKWVKTDEETCHRVQ
jgi:hypothetical protein